MALSFRHMIILLAQCASLYTVLAIPLDESYMPHDLYKKTHSMDQTASEPLFARSDDHKPLLRIMPLGASITLGINAPQVGGYRKPLRDELRYQGYPVNMIGCKSEGKFNDNQHEGHPGQILSEVRKSLECSIGQKPNLVLLNAGTNDCSRSLDLDGAADRMKDIVNRLFDQIHGVTILVSTLLVNGNERTNENIEAVNEDYRRLVRDMAKEGHKIALAEMNDGFITSADINPKDGTHPTPHGYTKMASVWTATIGEVAARDWVEEPAEKCLGPDDGEIQNPKLPVIPRDGRS